MAATIKLVLLGLLCPSPFGHGAAEQGPQLHAWCLYLVELLLCPSHGAVSSSVAIASLVDDYHQLVPNRVLGP